MIVDGQKEKPNHAWAGPVLLLIGLLTGALIGYRIHELATTSTMEEANRVKPPKLSPLLRRTTDKIPAPENDLHTFYLNIEPAHAETLQRVRDRAMERSQIVQEDGDTVPATLRFEKRTYPVELRIKGDLADHVSGDQWSYRIHLDEGKLLGMRAFSIQAPATRGYLWEWLVHQAARKAGILAPHSLFVNVVINNNPAGIYFLEEHFAKELLESQGRREGPIVLFDESTFWWTHLQRHTAVLGGDGVEDPAPIHVARDLSRATVRAFGEKRLTSLENLNRELTSALDKIRDAQHEIIAARYAGTRLDRLRSLAALEGKTMDRVMDTELWGKAHALASIFQIWHGMVWINLRFYYNPVTDRLEPIMYDNMAQIPSVKDPIIFLSYPLVSSLAQSGTYTLSFHRNLARFCETPFFEDLFKEVAPEIQRYQKALDAEIALPADMRFDALKQRLRAQIIYLKEMIRPIDPVNFDCAFEKHEGNETTLRAACKVKAWSTTKMPPVLLGFRFSNDHFISARSCLACPESYRPVLDGQGVMLPPDGDPLYFEFPADWRLTNLRNIKELKRALRDDRTDAGAAKPDEIRAVYRMAAGGPASEEALVFHPLDASWTLEKGRPEFPTLAEALKRHACLDYDLESDLLSVREGTWAIEGDLFVPSGYSLHIPAGVTLQFAKGAALVTDSALFTKGEPEAPVTFEPQEGASSFSGILVLKAKERSSLEHTVIRNTDSLTRKGWMTTGGITFYHSPVTFSDCRIDGTLAEDGLNLFGLDFFLERVTFTGCASDSFDGDFVIGTVRDCVFRDGMADGVDFSGSDVTVENCTFLDLADKAFSVGEKSRCLIKGGTIERTSIGVASKDLSDVKIERLSIGSVRHFAVAVYIKKPEYGPSRVEATGLTLGEAMADPFLVQTGCELLIEGNRTPTRDVDVKRLYDEGVLGN